MVDANCALTIERAMAFLPVLKANDIFWFEEPIASHDYRGHKELAAIAKDYNVSDCNWRKRLRGSSFSNVN